MPKVRSAGGDCVRASRSAAAPRGRYRPYRTSATPLGRRATSRSPMARERDGPEGHRPRSAIRRDGGLHKPSSRCGGNTQDRTRGLLLDDRPGCQPAEAMERMSVLGAWKFGRQHHLPPVRLEPPESDAVREGHEREAGGVENRRIARRPHQRLAAPCEARDRATGFARQFEQMVAGAQRRHRTAARQKRLTRFSSISCRPERGRGARLRSITRSAIEAKVAPSPSSGPPSGPSKPA